MTPEQIDTLIASAGLADAMRIFDYTIEISGPSGFELEPDAYQALSMLLTACAVAERERVHTALIQHGGFEPHILQRIALTLRKVD